MAAYITHLVLAEKEFDKHFQQFDRAHFYIGCNFPDIRYLARIDRDKTHSYNLTLQSVLNASTAFQAGILFHCLVDEIRERFVQERGIYGLAPQSKYITQAIKLFEDEIYYSQVKNLSTITDSLDTVLSEELTYGIPEDVITKWHALGKDYCKRAPTPESRELFIKGIGFDQAVADEINGLVKQLQTKKEVNIIVEDFWVQFDTLLARKK